MPWNVNFNPSLGIIEEVFYGLVTASELTEATSQRISLQKETSITKILNDVSDIKLEASVIDILNFPDKQYPEENVDRKTRMALILPKCNKARNMAEFFMTASLNRGWTVGPFEERQSALDWLQTQQLSKNHA
jgi:hypothetical protein